MANSRVFKIIFFAAKSLLILNLLCGHAKAESIPHNTVQPESRETNPNPRGTAKSVVGNVLIPVSAVAGGLLIASGLMSSRCNEGSQAYSRSGCQNQKATEVLGAVIALAGVSTGIYLKIDGKDERREWEKWEDEHRANDARRKFEVGWNLSLASEFSMDL